MAIFSDRFKGFLLGAGLTAFGYWAHKKHHEECGDTCCSDDSDIKKAVVDPEALSLEDLLKEKERLENLIADLEMKEAEDSED